MWRKKMLVNAQRTLKEMGGGGKAINLFFFLLFFSLVLWEEKFSSYSYYNAVDASAIKNLKAYYYQTSFFKKIFLWWR